MPGEFFVRRQVRGIRAAGQRPGRARRDLLKDLDEIFAALSGITCAAGRTSHDAILDGEIITARGAEILAFSDCKNVLGRNDRQRGFAWPSTPAVLSPGISCMRRRVL